MGTSKKVTKGNRSRKSGKKTQKMLDNNTKVLRKLGK